MKKNPSLIALVGPTASGKSDIAIQLALLLAERGQPCEIISADSMLVYRHMDIGTAKPDAEQVRLVPHNLINVVEPVDDYNVSRFRKEASRVVENLLEEGKGAIVVGGTGLYFTALIDGLNDAPSDREVRDRLEREGREIGAKVMYDRLLRIDSEAAEKIHPQNLRRTIRALEVYELSGKTFTQFHREQVVPAWKNDFLWFGLNIPFEQLDSRIDARTRIMFDNGLIGEVRKLLTLGCQRGCTSMQGLGYKEVVQGLEEGLSEAEMIELIAQRTRRYARRQMTWWRREKRVCWFEPSTGDSKESALRILCKLGN